MSGDSLKTDDVFGIARDVPPNYVERDRVDDTLRNDIDRGKHVVIYGSSKQGKTCLRKHCIDQDDQIVVHCSNKWELSEIHSAILKKAGYEITLSEKRTAGGNNKIKAEFGGSVAGLSAKVGGESGTEQITEETTRELELDPEDVNDVIRALNDIDFEKYIVLEDFHYLEQDVQEDFAVALKAFHEASTLNFVIVGVWLEENRLIAQNGDLAGRVIAVNADKWNDSELYEVIEKGEELLNIEFDEDFERELVSNCSDSVYVIQEACQRACNQAGVTRKQEEHIKIGENIDAQRLIQDVVEEQSARYDSFIIKFADGFQETDLEMYRWLLYPILTANPTELEQGLRYRTMRSKIERWHPEGNELNPGNLTQALQSVSSLQSKINIKPFVLDYDQSSKRLTVVDRGFLIWLANQDPDILLSQAGLDKYLDT